MIRRIFWRCLIILLCAQKYNAKRTKHTHIETETETETERETEAEAKTEASGIIRWNI